MPLARPAFQSCSLFVLMFASRPKLCTERTLTKMEVKDTPPVKIEAACN